MRRPVAAVRRASCSGTNALAAIKIAKIQYDSPGSDDGSKNSCLNAEIVVIENTGNGRVSLCGLVLKDRTGHRYTFDSFRLQGCRSVKVHAGSVDRNDGDVRRILL